MTNDKNMDLNSRQNGQQRRKLNALLDILTSEEYWGKITITYRKGIPVHAEKNEGIKLD